MIGDSDDFGGFEVGRTVEIEVKSLCDSIGDFVGLYSDRGHDSEDTRGLLCTPAKKSIFIQDFTGVRSMRSLYFLQK